MKSLVSFVALITLFGSTAIKTSSTYQPEKRIEKQSVREENKKIQLALLLDSSNSMDGLIDQAKAKLWNVVNEMTEMEADATLEIALYHYGNDGLRQMDHYVERLAAFTTDVDEISNKLFSIKTNGGKEYCGAAMYSARKELIWDADAMYKVLFIAGNEPFNQGPIAFRTVLDDLQEAGVYVNTIFCGEHTVGKNTEWNVNELLGRGRYFSLNKDEKIQYIQTPYDEKLQSLNDKLNKTYIPYGQGGIKKLQNLKMQDQNAATYGTSNVASRAAYKAKKQYNNASWDLLDAYDHDENILSNESDLPKAYKALSAKERKEKITLEKKKRAQIKEEIAQVSRQRTAYINDQDQTTEQLDDQIIQAVRQQLRNAGRKLSSLQRSRVDYDGFQQMVNEVSTYRNTRMISLAEFHAMSSDPSTIILDTRSKAMYDKSHVDGAIHLNFSDFGEKKLAKLIPSKETRILIYCNNNIRGNDEAYFGKMAPLALNIPTFINLYGYGYKNIYELGEDVEYSDNRITFIEQQAEPN